MSLTLDEYQRTCTTFALYPGQGTFIGLAYATIGLNGEAGETGEQVKKTWRDDAADIEAGVLQALKRLEERLQFAAPETHQEHFAETRALIHSAFEAELTEERKSKIVKEMGDCLWYMSQMATEIGVSLGDVAQINIDKLAARRAANKIHGEGSDR